jgi:pyruvate/2-oxoglutarate dehydrogenase complex dihydrolipoamide dehydrogenase (E3) component
MSSFDVLIIGGGQAGPPLALAKAGKKVALAERKYLGGSGVNFGCTPTKAAIASARVAHLARRAAAIALELEGIQFRLNARIQSIDQLRDTRVFLATGRTPNTDDLGLETVGMETTPHGFVKVNTRLATMFTDPELGRVGLTEHEAREKGLKFRVSRTDSHVHRHHECRSFLCRDPRRYSHSSHACRSGPERRHLNNIYERTSHTPSS